MARNTRRAPQRRGQGGGFSPSVCLAALTRGPNEAFVSPQNKARRKLMTTTSLFYPDNQNNQTDSTAAWTDGKSQRVCSRQLRPIEPPPARRKTWVRLTRVPSHPGRADKSTASPVRAPSASTVPALLNNNQARPRSSHLVSVRHGLGGNSHEARPSAWVMELDHGATMAKDREDLGERRGGNKNHVSQRRAHAQALGPENNGRLHVHLAPRSLGLAWRETSQSGPVQSCVCVGCFVNCGVTPDGGDAG